MEQDPTLPNESVDSVRNLITKLINHYEPDAEVTDEYYQSISEKYPDTDSLITKLIGHYEPQAEVTTGYLEGLYDTYNVKKKRKDQRPKVAVDPQEVPLEETMVAASPSQDGASVSTEAEPEDDGSAERLLSLFREELPVDEVFEEKELFETPEKKPVQDQQQREALDIAGLEDVPTSQEFRGQEAERKERQSASNEDVFGIYEPDENLWNYTEVPAPNYVKNNEDVKTYLSSQIGSVNREVNQVMSNPEAFGFPERILSANEEDIQRLINEMWAVNAPRTDQEDWASGKSINLEESYFRNIARESIDNFIQKYEVDRNNQIFNETQMDYARNGLSPEQVSQAIYRDLSSEDASKMNEAEKSLYDVNSQLKGLRNKLSKENFSDNENLQKQYNNLLIKASELRENLGSDRKPLYNLMTGQHVDKLDDNSMDLGSAIEEAKERLTYEENIEDVYVKAGLAANEHAKYGLDTKRTVEIPLSNFNSRAAINYLESKGYKRRGAGYRVVGFDGVSLSDISNFSVRGSLDDEELREEAERWLDRNIDLTVDRVAARDMSLLNLDPGKYKKSKYARFKEIVDSEFAPKGYDVGYISDVKLVDSSIAQLRDHGIELTKEQEENAKRGIGLEVTEGVAGFVPVIVELFFLNKAVGAATAITGIIRLIRTLKSGSKIQRGLAVLMEAGIEEGTMQTADFKTGTGFSYSLAGKGLSKLGLDKFPFKFKGELARLNKSADVMWSNGIKGIAATEFAGNVEAAIADLEGGETMKNYLDQNYKDLSQVGRRALVNMFVFQMIGAGELVGKGKGGFNIRRMEEARNELQRKGHNEEAKELDNYIDHYYDGKKGKIKNASYNDLRETIFENLRTNKESTLVVESMDKVPEQFRDRAEEIPAVETEVDVTFLGIPTGKKKRVEGKPTYRYKVSGKEMADLFFERKGNKSDKDFETEYNQKRYEDKEQDQKDQGTTEPTETGVVKVTKEPKVFTTPTEKRYATVNRNDGKGEVTLSRSEYEAELARQFAESREAPAPKEPAAKEQLAIGGGKAEPKEAAPVEKIEKELADDKYELSDENRLNEGGTRFVQEVDGGIIKVAEDDAGIIQNKQEGVESWTPQVIERGYDYVIVEKVNTKENKVLSNFFKDLDALKFNDFKLGSEKIKNLSEKYNLTNLDNYIEDVMYGDFVAHEQWGEKNGQIMLVDAGSLVAKPSEAQKGKTQQLDNIESLEISKNEKRDAIQEQAAGKVPVQPEAKAGEKVEKGKPKAEPEKPTQKGKEEVVKEEPVAEEKTEVKRQEEESDNPVDQQLKEKEVDEKIEESIKEEPKETQKDNLPVVFSSLSEGEKKKVEDEAKKAKKSTYDYISDYFKGKLKSVKDSVKKILDKLKANYKKALLITSIVSAVAGGAYKGYQYRSVAREALKDNLIEFGEKNPKLFNELTEASSDIPYLYGIMSSAGSLSGAIKSPTTNYEKANISVDKSKESSVDLKKNTFSKILGSKKEQTGRGAVEVVSYRSQFPASIGHEVILGGNNNEKAAVQPKVGGVSHVIHYMLDGSFLTNKNYDPSLAGSFTTLGGKAPFVAVERFSNNIPMHKRSFDIDGYVPYITKRVGDRAVLTYKRYSEIADTSKSIKEVLADPNILTPLRQYRFGDIMWNKKPSKRRPDSKTLSDGDMVYRSAVEKLLKPGVPNPYREGITKDEKGNPLNKRGTYLFWTPASGDATYGKYNGGSVVFIFEHKGETFARDFAGSINDIRDEGFGIARDYGISPNDITIGYHDVGSVSGKTKSENGVITAELSQRVNANGIVTSAVYQPIENKILVPEKAPTTPTEKGGVPIEMALPLLFAGVGKKRRKNIRVKGKEAKGVLEAWMDGVQKRYDSNKAKETKKSKISKALSESTKELVGSGALDRLNADQKAEVLSKIESESKRLVPDLPVSIVSETKGLTIREQFKQGFEEYIQASKAKDKVAREKAKTEANKKIDSLKEKLKEASESVKDSKEARKFFNDMTKDIAKEFKLSGVSKSKLNKIMARSAVVDQNNVDKLLSEVFDVIESEFKRNLANEAGVKEKAFVGRIKASKFGTLTEVAKKLSSVSAGDIPLSLMPRYVDLMTALSKPKPSAKDLSDLSEFMSDYKTQVDRRLKDIQHFADVRENFQNQDKTEKWRDYLEEQGYSDSDVDFATNPENLKQIKIARKSFYEGTEGKEMSPEEKVFKISERIKSATKMFLGMRTTGEASVDMKKYVGQAQREIDIAQFFNDLKPTDIKYLTPSEAESLPEIYANLNSGMVVNDMKRIMNRVIGERTLDSFVDSPIKREEVSVPEVKTLGGKKGAIVLPEKTFKSVVSNVYDLKTIQKQRRKTSNEDEIDFISSLGDIDRVVKKAEKEILDYVDEVVPSLKGKPLYTQISKVIRPLASVNRNTAEVYDELATMFSKIKGDPLFNSTLMSVYFRTVEFNNNIDKKVNRNPIEYIDETIQASGIPPKKKAVLQGIRKQYFSKGQPKEELMRLELDNRNAGKVIDFMYDKMNDLAPDVRFMSEVDLAKSFQFVFNYQPRVTKDSGEKPLQDVLSTIGPASGRPSLKTSAVQDRTQEPSPLNFDAFDDFIRTYSSIHMQRDVAPAMEQVSSFVSAAKRSGNSDAKDFATILDKLVRGYVEGSIAKEYRERSYFGNLGVKASAKMKRNILSGITKPVVEGTIQVAKLAIDADANLAFREYMQNPPKEHTRKDVLGVLGSVHTHRAGILSAEMARERSYLLDQVRRGKANTAEEIMYKISSSPLAKGVSGTDKFIGDINTVLIKAPDLIGQIPQVVLGATALKFNEVTGNKIDFDKVVSDPLYRAKYKDALQLAIGYGDQIGTRMAGPGAIEQRSIADIKGEGLLHSPLNRFVRNFSTGENNQMQSAVATMIPASTKIMRKERGAEFENKKKAARGFAASMVGISGYKIGRIAMNLLVYGIVDALFSDDDDELFENWDKDEVASSMLADLAWTAIAGRYGVIESVIIQSLVVSGLKISAKGTDKEEQANKIADAMFYTTIDNRTPLSKGIGSLGAEGKIVSSLLDLGHVVSTGEFDINKYSTRNALYSNYMWMGNILAQQDLGKTLRKIWRDDSVNMKFNEAFGRASGLGSSPNVRKITNRQERLLMKLYEKSNDRYLIPSLVSDKRTIKGDRYFINQSYQRELQKIKADYVVKQISDVSSDSRFRNSSESGKIKILKEAIQGFGSKEDFPKRLKDKGIQSLNDYYEKYGDKVSVD